MLGQPPRAPSHEVPREQRETLSTRWVLKAPCCEGDFHIDERKHVARLDQYAHDALRKISMRVRREGRRYLATARFTSRVDTSR